MSTRSGLASARISRRCGVDSTTVHERYVQYVTNPQRPSATVNIELGNQNFFATGHVQCFSGKRGRQCSERRADAAGRLDQAPLIPPPARLHGRPAGGVRHSAVSTSSKVARNSLASFDENTSGGRIFRICPSCPVALISTSRRPALMAFRTAWTPAGALAGAAECAVLGALYSGAAAATAGAIRGHHGSHC